jgi:hypothetical protein
MVPTIIALICSLAFLTAAPAEELFSFQYQGKVLAFTVSSHEPIMAPVDQSTPANVGLKWAIRFYRLRDANVDGIEFRTDPTRFWLVRLSGGNKNEALYSIVLPDGSIVEPTNRERI